MQSKEVEVEADTPPSPKIVHQLLRVTFLRYDKIVETHVRDDGVFEYIPPDNVSRVSFRRECSDDNSAVVLVLKSDREGRKPIVSVSFCDTASIELPDWHRTSCVYGFILNGEFAQQLTKESCTETMDMLGRLASDFNFIFY
jgi:hypothetical protein